MRHRGLARNILQGDAKATTYRTMIAMNWPSFLWACVAIPTIRVTVTHKQKIVLYKQKMRKNCA